MNKAIIFCASFFLLSTSVYAQTTASENFLTNKELQKKEKMENLAKERNEETNRFKRKAIERAQTKEQQKLEKQKERTKKASRFQKEALEKDAQKVAEQKNLATTVEKSRFTQKAQKKTAKRAAKKREILERKKNNIK